VDYVLFFNLPEENNASETLAGSPYALVKDRSKTADEGTL